MRKRSPAKIALRLVGGGDAAAGPHDEQRS